MGPMRHPELPARDKRLIFTITTGHSGTRHLAWALGCFRDVDARHEPKPSFSGAFRTVCTEPETAAEFWRAHKLPSIASTKKPIYAETSHLACKGFLESLIELGYRPDLIHLHRDPREVATSLWRLDSVPGRTSKGVKYNLAPTDPCFLSLRGAGPAPGARAATPPAALRVRGLERASPQREAPEKARSVPPAPDPGRARSGGARLARVALPRAGHAFALARGVPSGAVDTLPWTRFTRIRIQFTFHPNVAYGGRSSVG